MFIAERCRDNRKIDPQSMTKTNESANPYSLDVVAAGV